MQTHLSEEVDISETLSQQQDVSVPAQLGAPAQVLSNGQRQIPRVVAEPQQVRLVHPHLGQTCWGRGQRVGWAVTQKKRVHGLFKTTTKKRFDCSNIPSLVVETDCK